MQGFDNTYENCDRLQFPRPAICFESIAFPSFRILLIEEHASQCGLYLNLASSHSLEQTVFTSKGYQKACQACNKALLSTNFKYLY